MDRVAIFNEKSSQTLSLLSIDDYYLPDQSWLALGSTVQRNAYLWQPDIFEGDQS